MPDNDNKIGLVAVLDLSKFSKNTQAYANSIAQLNKLNAQFAADVAKMFGGTSTTQAAQHMADSLKPVGSGVTDLGKKMKEAGEGSRKFGSEVRSLATELGLMYGLGQIVGMVKDFTAASHAAARSQNDARNALTGLLGSSEKYRDAIQQVQTATRGTLSETEAAQTAFGLLDNGIAKTAEEAAQYALAGKALNSALGETASYEKFLMLLDEGSDMLLNNFNITGSAVEARRRLIEAEDGVAESESKLIAVRQLALEKGLALADGISQETIAAQQATAAFADFQASFGQLVIELDKSTGATSFMTAAFQQLTTGAKAWQGIIQDQIPAIQAHDAALARDAAQALLTAQNQEEMGAALKEGSRDFKAFQSELVGSVGDYDEYKSVISEATKNNMVLAGQLALTAEEFDAAREAMRQAAADAVASSGQWVSSLEAMGLTAANTAASIRDIAAAQQQVNQGQLDLRLAKETMPEIGVRLSESRTAAFEEAQKREEAESRASERIAKANERAAKQMSRSMTDAAQDMANVISSVLQPTLDEVWTPPEGSIVRFDEAARRMATVATSGFGSEWLQQLNTQFTGQDFFKPITEAMQSGDEGALKQAATDILTHSVTNLWDPEVIKQKVREQLQQQNLRQQIIDQVYQELSAEGVSIAPEQITAIATGGAEISGGFSEAGQAASDMGATVAGAQKDLTSLATTFNTITATNLPTLITKLATLSTALNTAGTNGINAGADISTAMDEAVTAVKGTVEDFKWDQLGKAIDQGIAKGVQDNRHLVLEKLKTLARDAIQAARDELGIASPSTVFAELGRQIAQGLVVGINTGTPQFQAALDQLLGIDRSILSTSGLIGAAADDVEKFFDRMGLSGSKTAFAMRVLKDVFRANSAEILNATDRVAKFRELALRAVNWEAAGFSGEPGRILQGAFGNFLAHFDRRQREAREQMRDMFIEAAHKTVDIGSKLLELGQAAANRLNTRVDTLAALLNTGASEFQFEGQIISAVQAQEMLNAAMIEQRDIQDDIFQMQQAQARLGFLQQQLDLLKTVKDAGLDIGSIFGGLSFGLDASLPDMIEAINRVVTAMIDQANEDLQIASPSKVMARIGAQMMAGLGQGIDNAVSTVQNSLTGAYHAIAGPANVAQPVLLESGGRPAPVFNFSIGAVNSREDADYFAEKVVRVVAARL